MIVEHSEIDNKELIELNYKQDMWIKNRIPPQLNLNYIEDKSVNHIKADGYNMLYSTMNKY